MKKKEVQSQIVPKKDNKKVTEEEFNKILKLVSPGTHLRSALDGALRAGKGALMVVENTAVLPIIDGGFKVNCKFSPQRFTELCKMDGAIVLSSDLKKITHANVILAPKNSIKTEETGSRHKAAERTAKQTQTLVISISERRKIITLFYKNKRHTIIGTGELLRRVNEHVQLLEKQREIFDRNIDLLNRLELSNYPSLKRAISAIRRGFVIQDISQKIKKSLIELGKEGALLSARLKELTEGVQKETNLIIKDYTNLSVNKTIAILVTLAYEELLDSEHILRALDQESFIKTDPIPGWRILSKTSLTEKEISMLIKQTKFLGKALYSSPSEYKESIGTQKAQSFKEEIERMKLNF